MRNLVIATCAAGAVLGITSLAQAMPFGGASHTESDITLIADGCGPGFHRGPYGGCRPNGPRPFFAARACPPGFHLGPMGRRCRPNF